MNIKKCYKSIDTFEDFDKFLSNANTKVTFWGNKIVKINEHTGSLKIDVLVRKFLSILNKNIDFDESKRPLIKKISASIDNLYEESDRLLSISNFFTKFLHGIAYLFSRSSCSKERWRWNISDHEDYDSYIGNNIGYHHICNLYNKRQYQNLLGKEPDRTTGYTVIGIGPYYQKPGEKPLKGSYTVVCTNELGCSKVYSKYI